MLIEIVSHCFSTHLPHYADALCYQLSSLVSDGRWLSLASGIDVTVCCDKNDSRTYKVLDWFGSEVSKYYNLKLEAIYFDPPHLGRRAIGRNVAAKNTRADLVWFADVDQVYRGGCLGRLLKIKWPNNAVMIYPKKIKIHKDHATGDIATKLIDGNPRLIDINPNDFIDKKYNKAIGGVQIVKGDFAREHGYLDGFKKWQKPNKNPFSDFRDDLAYRRFCNDYGKTVGVDLPGMFRIRHTTTTYQ